jgi:hypothetical protein
MISEVRNAVRTGLIGLVGSTIQMYRSTFSLHCIKPTISGYCHHSMYHGTPLKHGILSLAC